MNEYLFRGKTKETHEWIYGGIAMMDGRYFIVKTQTYYDNTCSWGAYEVDPDTVGQFIGKVDKHGNKIFRGDLCLVTFPNSCISEIGDDRMMLGRCEVDKFETGFICLNKVADPYQWYNHDDFSEERCELVEVVGNIYDNADYICPVCGIPWNHKCELYDGTESCRACGEFI